MNNPIVPQLYRPSVSEVTRVCTSAKMRHPELIARLEKASAILLTGGLTLDSVAWERGQMARWKVSSQSGNGAYIVCGTSCPCQDKRTPCCKHVIAASLYTKVLTNRINSDIRARQIDLGILENGEFHAYAKGMGYVQMRKVGMAYVFVDAASAVRYSMWMAAASPVTIYVGGTPMEVYA